MRNGQRREIRGHKKQESNLSAFFFRPKTQGKTCNGRQFFGNQIWEFEVNCLSRVCPHVMLLVVWKCWQRYQSNNSITFLFFEQVGSRVYRDNRKIHFLLDLFSYLGGNSSLLGKYRFITHCYKILGMLRKCLRSNGSWIQHVRHWKDSCGYVIFYRLPTVRHTSRDSKTKKREKGKSIFRIPSIP